MIGLRRVAVLVGFGAVLLERLVSGAGPSLDAIVLVVLGVLAHYAGSFFAPDTHARSDFLTLRIVLVSVVNSLCVVMSHHLSVLLRARAEDGRALAAERGVLLANYEREATRVRLLLDIAQRASATP